MDEYSDLRQKERRVAVVIAIFLVPLVAAFAIHLLSRKTRSPTGSILVVTSGTKQGTPNASAAPAVPAEQVEQRLTAAQATTGGDVEVSLAWNSLSDLDIGLREPSGFFITARNRKSPSGGKQDVDANPTLVTAEGEARADAGHPPGAENLVPVPEALVDMDEQLPRHIRKLLALYGSSDLVEARFTRRPVEHIYFADAPSGKYTVYAQCYSWREPNDTPLPFTIQVRSRGKVMYEWTGKLGPASYAVNGTGPIQACQFVIR